MFKYRIYIIMNIGLFILEKNYKKDKIDKYYLKDLKDLKDLNIYTYKLYQEPDRKKPSNNIIRECLDEYLESLVQDNIKLLIVTQPEYFKLLSGQIKTDITIGNILDAKYLKYQKHDIKITYCPVYTRIFYDPINIEPKIRQSLNAVIQWSGSPDNHHNIGSDIIHFVEYPDTYEDIKNWLDKLLEMNCDLTCDIETFSLKHYDAGIGTITFCWNEHEGIAFPVDMLDLYSSEKLIEAHTETLEDFRTLPTSKEVMSIREALRDFFVSFSQTGNNLLFHNIAFDVYVLIYQLFMKDILDQEGMLKGIDIFLSHMNWDCTQTISYLAVNSCAGNELSLKIQAQEYAGDYAVEDIKDITKVPLDKLLKYNLIDGLSTWFVYKKNYKKLLDRNQKDVYEKLFKYSLIDIIQMQLTGLPMNMVKVRKLEKEFKIKHKDIKKRILNNQVVKELEYNLKLEFIDIKNKEYKKKRIGLNDELTRRVVFNPASTQHLRKLFYEENYLNLEIIDYTDTGLPATGTKVLSKLLTRVKDKNTQELLQLFVDFKAYEIILNTFIPAFLNAKEGPDNWHYLFGNFRLGGTVSGRLSSNSPNLQNISSGGSGTKGKIAKSIKECFEAPKGWLFVGLDFDSLEDKISALTTKDPNKMRVYTDGFDGHCLRAFGYYRDEMPDIEMIDEDSDDKGYEIELDINGTKEFRYFSGKTLVIYKGQKITVEELYKLESSI